ncbi:MAG TPA: T9SS type A sorting domain-containing protein [Paludibacteraceae bacterium]|nr:T9SS type A sorting domain-containing protein [Paludibacteraceae bacterium]
MKKSILLSFLMLMPFLLMAQVIYYVNPSHPSASNMNPGTNPELPWLNLNQVAWTDGCIVKVSAGVYTPNAYTSNLNNITIEGTSTNDVIIQGMTDEEFNGETVFTTRPFAVNASYFATFKNVTIKNFKLDPLSQTNSGGLCRISSGGVMNLENVVIKNIKWHKYDGGAIYSQGTLNFTNTIFDNCVARKGGAVFAAGDGLVTLKNCKFINNNTIDDTIDDYKYGGAITLESSMGTLFVDSCYFENNRVDVPTKSKAVGGGAIALRIGEAYNVTAIIKNSTFNNNFNYTTGAAIGTTQASTIKTSANINIDIRNCTFLNNKTDSTRVSEGSTINLYGASTVLYEGKMTLVNNTFLNNTNRNPGMKSIFSNDHAIDFTFINNIFLDAPKTKPEDEMGVGNSIVINPLAENSKIRSMVCRNNIIDKWGGSITGTQFPEWMSETTNNQTGKYNDAVLLNTTLTVPITSSVPYLELKQGSRAIDAGLDSYLENSIEIIPAKDIRGMSIKGLHKDLGAFEYDGPTGIIYSKVIEDVDMFFPNPFKQYISVKQKANTLEIYSITGKLVRSAQNQSIIYTDDLPQGFYIVKAKLDNNQEITAKLRK